MLTPPPLPDHAIIERVHHSYGLEATNLYFLPLGADQNTAVYRFTASNEDYFLKLRRGDFIDATVTVPYHLATHGLRHVIPPLPTKTNQLWTPLDPFMMILYPYIEGHNGVETPLSDEQWHELGTALHKLHNTTLLAAITQNLPRETFSSPWPQKVQTFLARIKEETFAEPTAAKMAGFLKSKCEETLSLIDRTETLAALLKQQPLEYVLCHADIHGWNILIDKKDKLSLIDWDTLVLAPKERDLMFIGAGISPTGRPPFTEEPLFYDGYGDTEVNQDAITYYRYARILEDVGEYCEQIFLSDEGGEDRLQSFEYLQSNFLPDGTIERARRADKGFP